MTYARANDIDSSVPPLLHPEVVTDVHQIYGCAETQLFNSPSGH